MAAKKPVVSHHSPGDYNIEPEPSCQFQPTPPLLYRTADEVLDWDQYFMSVAYLSAMRSKDSSCQVGACIVNKSNRIVGVGYNGMPDQCGNNSTPRNNDNDEVWEPSVKRYYVCHAEPNAIINAFGGSLQGCRIYVTRTPCNECAKFIVQSGISEVICHSTKAFGSYYDNAKEAGEAAMNILERAQVEIRCCRLDLNKIFSSFQKSYDENNKYSNKSENN